jgi:hypothetical protein
MEGNVEKYGLNGTCGSCGCSFMLEWAGQGHCRGCVWAMVRYDEVESEEWWRRGIGFDWQISHRAQTGAQRTRFRGSGRKYKGEWHMGWERGAWHVELRHLCYGSGPLRGPGGGGRFGQPKLSPQWPNAAPRACQEPSWANGLK